MQKDPFGDERGAKISFPVLVFGIDPPFEKKTIQVNMCEARICLSYYEITLRQNVSDIVSRGSLISQIITAIDLHSFYKKKKLPEVEGYSKCKDCNNKLS